MEKSAGVESTTFTGYAQALRKIVADSFGIESTNKRFGSRGGYLEWVAQVNAVELAALTPALVQVWKRAYLAKHDDPVKTRSAKVSVNSFMRRARSLFSDKMLRHLGFEVQNPFEGVEFESRLSLKYRSTFDIKKLAQAAIKELGEDDPEACKVFFLAAGAGLRRGEMDALEWSAFLWNRVVIRIGPTKYFQPKSEYPIGDVEVDSLLMEIFKGYHEKARSSFVIEAPGLPKPQAKYVHYRCQEHFERLSAWLRSKGVSTHKPLHTLRKEFGSLICDEDGIYAASRALRHSSIGVTDAYYTDKRLRVTVGLDRLIGES